MRSSPHCRRSIPTAPPVLNLVAVGHVAAGRLDAARATYARILAAHPTDLEALNGVVVLDIQAGRAKDAAARIDRTSGARHPDAAMLMLAGQGARGGRGPRKAEALLKQAIDIEPDRLMAYSSARPVLCQPEAAARRPRAVHDARREEPDVRCRPTPCWRMIMEAQGDKAAAEAQYQKTLVGRRRGRRGREQPGVALGVVRPQPRPGPATGADRVQGAAELAAGLDTLGWAFYRRNMMPPGHPPPGTVGPAGSERSRRPTTTSAWPIPRSASSRRPRQSLQKALAMNPNFERSGRGRRRPWKDSGRDTAVHAPAPRGLGMAPVHGVHRVRRHDPVPLCGRLGRRR